MAEFTDILRQAAAVSIPKTSKPGPEKLFIGGTQRSKKTFSALKRKAPDHPNRDVILDQNHIERNTCRQAIQDAKRACWEEFLDSSNATQSTADLWAKVNALSGEIVVTPPTLNIDGSSTADPEIITDGLGKYFDKPAAFGSYDSAFVRQTGATANDIRSFTVPEDSAHCATCHESTFLI